MRAGLSISKLQCENSHSRRIISIKQQCEINYSVLQQVERSQFTVFMLSGKVSLCGTHSCGGSKQDK
jgi:hypothetical protein